MSHPLRLLPLLVALVPFAPGCVVHPVAVTTSSGGEVEVTYSVGCGGATTEVCAAGSVCGYDIYDGELLQLTAVPAAGFVVDRFWCDDGSETSGTVLSVEVLDDLACFADFVEPSCDLVDLAGGWRESYTCEGPEGACVEERIPTSFQCEYVAGDRYDCLYQGTGGVFTGDLVDCVYTWTYEDAELGLGYDEAGTWTFRDEDGLPTPDAFTKRSDCWEDLEDQSVDPLWLCVGYGVKGAATPPPAPTCEAWSP